MRPGRFDRHITVDRPTLAGRRELFEVHSRDVPLADDVDFERLARATVGMTGADIRNLVNEAALWATRNDQNAVHMSDFEYARDKVLMGPAREDVLTEEEKQITAYHEAGHALFGLAHARLRPRPQGDDHAPRPGAGRHAARARRRTLQHFAAGSAKRGWR